MSDAGRAADDHDAAARPPRRFPFPDDAAPLYTVGQVADMLGLQPAFLRRLDSQQVVTPQRSSGGQRRYSRREIDHIDAISGLLGEGMTLSGAKRIIELQCEVADLREQLAALGPPIEPDGPAVHRSPPRQGGDHGGRSRTA